MEQFRLHNDKDIMLWSELRYVVGVTHLWRALAGDRYEQAEILADHAVIHGKNAVEIAQELGEDAQPLQESLVGLASLELRIDYNPFRHEVLKNLAASIYAIPALDIPIDPTRASEIAAHNVVQRYTALGRCLGIPRGRNLDQLMTTFHDIQKRTYDQDITLRDAQKEVDFLAVRAAVHLYEAAFDEDRFGVQQEMLRGIPQEGYVAMVMALTILNGNDQFGFRVMQAESRIPQKWFEWIQEHDPGSTPNIGELIGFHKQAYTDACHPDGKLVGFHEELHFVDWLGTLSDALWRLQDFQEEILKPAFSMYARHLNDYRTNMLQDA